MATATKKAAQPESVTDRIKTWEDVLVANNMTQEQFDQQWSGRPDYDVATEQTRLIALALNEGIVMNVANTDEVKFYPWFWVRPNADKPSGFGLSYLGCGNSGTVASRGARLCFKNRRLAEYAGTQFTEIYERAMI